MEFSILTNLKSGALSNRVIRRLRLLFGRSLVFASESYLVTTRKKLINYVLKKGKQLTVPDTATGLQSDQFLVL